MTAPLTPPDCDCRGLAFMPLEVNKLLDSDLMALATGDEFKAALILWCKAWGQLPAASIPDDDRILARWTGHTLADWQGLREMALHGWVKCDDGRLYHPVISVLALEAYDRRRKQAAKVQSRWAKQRAAGAAAEIPRNGKPHTAVSGADTAVDAAVIPKTGTETETSPPLPPAGAGGGGLFGDQTDPPAKPVDEAKVAFDLWNETAKRCGLSAAENLNDQRRSAIKARLAESGLEGWRRAMKAVEMSPLCRGLIPPKPGHKQFRAHLDFVCQPSSFAKLLEGFYGTGAPPPLAARPAPRAWTGPDWILAAARHYGVAGDLSQASWQAEPPAIVTTSRTVADRLDVELGPDLRKQNIAIIVKGAKP